MLSDFIFAHILSVFLFIIHEWLTGLQEDKVVSAVFFFSFLDYITLPATFKTIHLNGFRQYECMCVCTSQSFCLSMCLLLLQVVRAVSVAAVAVVVVLMSRY